jgi:hypothetical protein
VFELLSVHFFIIFRPSFALTFSRYTNLSIPVSST